MKPKDILTFFSLFPFQLLSFLIINALFFIILFFNHIQHLILFMLPCNICDCIIDCIWYLIFLEQSSLQTTFYEILTEWVSESVSEWCDIVYFRPSYKILHKSKKMPWKILRYFYKNHFLARIRRLPVKSFFLIFIFQSTKIVYF